MKKKKNVIIWGIVAALIMVFAAVTISPAQSGKEAKYKFDKDGNLIRPEGYREWVYIGTPLTPNDLNPPEAAFPDFHNVYIHPDDYQYYKKNAAFQDGTILVKELVSAGSKRAVSGNGYFMGEFTGLEATIKDKTRYPDEPGNWVYFSFGHSYPLAETSKVFPTAACNTCHEVSAAEDFVFTQYYPVLRAARGKDAKPMMSGGARSASSMSAAAMSGDAMQAARGMVPIDPDKLFAYLKAGGYKDFTHESKMHPSAGPHDDVLTFFNPVLERSFKDGNKIHPKGAAAVKELYKNGKMYGWAAMVKTQNDDEDGSSWYWYEVTSTTDPTKIVAEGINAGFCAGCHSIGKDFVRIGYPLK